VVRAAVAEVAIDFLEAILEGSLGFRLFVFLVLKGFAAGARLIVPAVVAEVLAAGRCFLGASVDARAVAPTEIAKKSSAVVRR
jgi:hypothetical protein